MPSETRKLAFSKAELQAALVSYALRSKMKLPKAEIEKVIVSVEGDTSVRLIFGPSDPNEAAEVEFSQEHVAAAIILYCRDQSIPLPRDSHKVLLVEDNSISMMMQVHYAKKEIPATPMAAAETLEDAESEAIAADQARAVEGAD